MKRKILIGLIIIIAPTFIGVSIYFNLIKIDFSPEINIAIGNNPVIQTSSVNKNASSKKKINENDFYYNQANGYVRLAQSASNKKEKDSYYQMALKSYKKKSDKKAEDYNDMANIASLLKKYNEAIKNYDESIKINPKLYNTYYNRGNTKLEIGKDLENHYKQTEAITNYKDALKNYEIAIELKDGYWPALYKKSYTLILLKDYEKAIQEYNTLVTRNSYYADFYYGRGIAYNEWADSMPQMQRELKIKYWLQAFSDFSKAIIINAKVEYYTSRYNTAFQIFYFFSFVPFGERGMPGAEKHYINKEKQIQYLNYIINDTNMVIALNPDEADAYKNHGIAISALGELSKKIVVKEKNYQTAIKNFYSAQKLNQNDSDAFYYLAISNMKIADETKFCDPTRFDIKPRLDKNEIAKMRIEEDNCKIRLYEEALNNINLAIKKSYDRAYSFEDAKYKIKENIRILKSKYSLFKKAKSYVLFFNKN